MELPPDKQWRRQDPLGPCDRRFASYVGSSAEATPGCALLVEISDESLSASRVRALLWISVTLVTRNRESVRLRAPGRAARCRNCVLLRRGVQGKLARRTVLSSPCRIGHESGMLRYTREFASGAAYEGRAGLTYEASVSEL